MRRSLGLLLLLTLLLAGCGDSSDDEGGRADDPAPSDPTSSTGGPEETGWQLVEIVHATAAGGRVSTTPTPIPDANAVADFSAQFERPDLQQQIGRAIEKNAPAGGLEFVATVISIGCDVPPGVSYVDGEIRPTKVKEPMLECFAPVTSVAILVVEA